MNKFDNAFYDFITKPENFQQIFELSDKFEIFRERLIDDFWDKVIFKLKEKVTELDGWIPLKEDEVVKGYSAIAGLYNKKYCYEVDEFSVGTCFFNYGDGRVLYGVYFSKDAPPSLQYEKIINFASKNLTNIWKFAPKSWSFPIYKYTNDNFKKYSTLKKILPSEGDFLAEEYAETLITAHNELFVLIEKFGFKS